MKKFNDYYNNEVKLSFEDHPFDSDPRHVWVICKYKNQWLLTKHKDRGIEFPGGKVEPGESTSDAAKREVLEETGGVVEQLTYVGQYHVSGKSENVVKNIYFATISELQTKDHYFETEGPVFLNELPKNIEKDPAFSFIMKDQVLPYSLDNVNKLF